ncbi:MAG: Alpha-D-kanosaminyltransferase [Acidobacteria bacterium ADurb.Bin051]|jgi:glycosyltransferase involved in cell wall biosynthesis|nr:MAG: Alpha-D-kanosaminyltransferase [Acidobacteria bacterium ADurb.Bin051]
MKLAVVTTHPIQYQVPWFRALAARSGLDLTVGFGCLPGPEEQGIGFGVPFAWDVPLLDGYRWEELRRWGRSQVGSFEGIRLRGVAAWLHRQAPDALLVTGWNSLSLVQAALAARRSGIPVIARGDSQAGRRPLLRRLLLRLLLRLYSAFLVVGASNRRFYEQLGVPAARLFPCPHFVDNDRFAAAAAALGPRRAELRARRGLAEGRTVFLFAGKLEPKKRPLDLVRAAARARAEGADCQLLFAGDGELRAELEAATAALAVPATFAGFLNQSRIAEAYAAADCLVLPSDRETWGLVVNEAMVSGLPAVTSDQVGCAPDLIRAGETGWSFPCGDVVALASLLHRVAGDPGRSRAMGAAARELVRTQYGVDNAVEGTLAALRFVTGRA